MPPIYAHGEGFNCTACHTVAPQLNPFGEDYKANHYKTESPNALSSTDAARVAVWVTGQHKNEIDKGESKTSFPKVELIWGSSIGNSCSAFLEWRVGSQNRSGRIEDAFVNCDVGAGFSLRGGQFRPLNVIDVSLRPSISEQLLLSGSVPGDPSSNKRIQSLRAASLSGRSPGFALTHQSLAGDRASGGWFNTLTLPFPGEFSIPLSPAAEVEASPELELRPKGIIAESYYRWEGVNAIGAHAFVDLDRWIVGGMGTYNIGDFHVTAGAGMDGGDALPTRERYSAEMEYLFTGWDRFRPGLGVRYEHITNSEKDPAWISYLIFAGPNTDYTLFVQVECRRQEGNDTCTIDVSGVL